MGEVWVGDKTSSYCGCGVGDVTRRVWDLGRDFEPLGLWGCGQRMVCWCRDAVNDPYLKIDQNRHCW